MYGGLKFFKIGSLLCYRRQDFPLGPSDMIFQDLILLGGMWQVYSGVCGGEENTDGSTGGKRVLKLVVESREETLGYGARLMSTILLTSSRPKGGNTKLATSGNFATEGEGGLATWIIMISSRRNTRCKGFCIISAPPRPFRIRPLRPCTTLLPLLTIVRHT
jgi:hypothetical protein